MEVYVNGKPREVEGDVPLAALLDELGVDRTSIAVAVNRDVVPRRQHADVTLADGDHIEIVHAVQGG